MILQRAFACTSRGSTLINFRVQSEKRHELRAPGRARLSTNVILRAGEWIHFKTDFMENRKLFAFPASTCFSTRKTRWKIASFLMWRPRVATLLRRERSTGVSHFREGTKIVKKVKLAIVRPICVRGGTSQFNREIKHV